MKTMTSFLHIIDDKLLLEHIAIFWVFQLFVSHLVRMVFVTDLALVSVRLGGLTADAE